MTIAAASSKTNITISTISTTIIASVFLKCVELMTHSLDPDWVQLVMILNFVTLFFN